MTTLFQCLGCVVEPSYVSSDCCFHLISWNLHQNTGNWWSQETSSALRVNSRKVKLWFGKHKQIIDSSAAVAAVPAYQFAINFSVISLGLLAIFLIHTWHGLHPWACWTVFVSLPTNSMWFSCWHQLKREFWEHSQVPLHHCGKASNKPRWKRTAVSPGGRNDALPIDSISAGHEEYYKVFNVHSSKSKEWNFGGTQTPWMTDILCMWYKQDGCQLHYGFYTEHRIMERCREIISFNTPSMGTAKGKLYESLSGKAKEKTTEI